MTLSSAFLAAAVTIGTWNGEWFPSGRAEHRAAPEAEARTIAEAGKMLRKGFDAADPEGKNGIILCLNEMRGPKAARQLCEATGISNLQVAVVSAYRRRDRFDMQQDVIATTLPVASANWSKWLNSKADTPPRGYAHALIVLEPAVTASVYSVHLKSNYRQNTEQLAAQNRRKRSLSISQLVSQEKTRKNGRKIPPVVIAGDFNADKWSKDFELEDIFKTLADGGYRDAFDGVPATGRITFPGKGRWRNETLDYIMFRSLEKKSGPFIVDAGGISDHRPVFIVLE